MRLMTPCWCQRQADDVPAELVRAGRTWSCGRDDCTEDHAALSSPDHHPVECAHCRVTFAALRGPGKPPKFCSTRCRKAAGNRRGRGPGR